MFAAFIVACGLTHLIDATIFWHPWYRLSAVMKVTTAVVSWATVIAMVRIIPKALSMPGLADLRSNLEAQVRARSRSGEQLKQVIENLPLGRIMVDGNGRIKLFNRAAERLFGYSREEVIGQPVELLVPVRHRANHPSLREAYQREPSVRSMGAAGHRIAGTRRLVRSRSAKSIPRRVSKTDDDRGPLAMSAAPRVLIVDDDRNIVQVVAVRLQAAGCRINVAHDGEAGLAAAVNDVPDAIVLDIRMPQMDGLAVLGKLRGHPRTMHIPVIALSASAVDQSNALDAGADHFLAKPYDSKILLKSIHAVLKLKTPMELPSEPDDRRS